MRGATAAQLSGRGRKSSRVRRDAAREPRYAPILARRACRRSGAMRPDCICASSATTQNLLRNTYFIKQLDRFSSIESHLDAHLLRRWSITREIRSLGSLSWIDQVRDDMKKLPIIQILETSLRALWDIALLNIYAGSTLDGVAQ
jgi:hypothetical protein